MTGLLPRIERLLEGVVEGGSRRLFRQSLQPVELAKAAARAMQAGQVVGADGIDVPNAYVVRLHPDDYARFEPYRRSLEARLARYLTTFAQDRGLRPVADVEVGLVADPGVSSRRIQVDADMVDPSGPPTRASEPIEPTSLLPATRRAPSVSGALALKLEDGRRFRVLGEAVSLGRALDNDIVISDGRVSRYHAEIVADPPGHGIRDLGSTNGTSLAGVRIGQERLCDGDVISLGGFRIEVRVTASSDGTFGTSGSSRR